MPLVCDIFWKHKRRYGARRIAVELGALGHPCGVDRVAKLLKMQGLRAIQPQSYKPRTTNSKHTLGYSPAVRAIEKLNGTVRYKDSPSSRSAAMHWLLGDDKYSRVKAVDFPPFEAKVTDADLVHLEGLEGLEVLALCGTEVTDAGVARLQRLVHLRDLDLSYTRITDDGIVHLRDMLALERLVLNDTEVGNAAMAHLAHLTQMKELYLSHTHITDAGLIHLKSPPGDDGHRRYARHRASVGRIRPSAGSHGCPVAISSKVDPVKSATGNPPFSRRGEVARSR